MFNLVRPKVPGHRAALLHNLLGSMLVFETLEQAAAYRELVTQVTCTIRLYGCTQGSIWVSVANVVEL